MLDTLLDKLAGFFERRFMVAYWGPVFLTCAFAVGSLMTMLGAATVLGWWSAWSETEKALVGLAFFLSITVLAYMLQPMTVTIIQWYEGYWPRLLNLPTGWARSDQEWRKGIYRKAGESDRKASYHYNHDYPGVDLQPTLLGNILRAAEEYPLKVYGLDAGSWAPRLTPLLPEAFRRQLDDALTPLISLINLSALLALLTLSFGITVAFGDSLGITAASGDSRWWLMPAGVVIGTGLSRLCYEAAIRQARVYGDLTRVAFDLYRHKILKQMLLAIPDNLAEERVLWGVLNQLVLYGIDPWEERPNEGVIWPVRKVELVGKKFNYATHEKPSPDPIEVKISYEV
jgi:hypothetical protein